MARNQKMEEAFADELQLLAWKVISRKPDFHQDFDTMLKQCYASQLYDRSNASIANSAQTDASNFLYPILQ